MLLPKWILRVAKIEINEASQVELHTLHSMRASRKKDEPLEGSALTAWRLRYTSISISSTRCEKVLNCTSKYRAHQHPYDLSASSIGVSKTAVGGDAYREALAAGQARVEALHRRVRRGRHGRRRGEGGGGRRGGGYDGPGRNICWLAGLSEPQFCLWPRVLREAVADGCRLGTWGGGRRLYRLCGPFRICWMGSELNFDPGPCCSVAIAFFFPNLVLPLLLVFGNANARTL